MQTRSLVASAAALMGAVLLVSGCDTLGTDSSRFLDPSAVIKAPCYSPMRPINAGLSVADYTPDTVPGSTPPNESDLTYKVEDYIIGPTDIIDITVLDLYEPNQEAQLRKQVSTTGYIDMPLVGTLKIEGLTASQAKQAIINAYSPDILRSPTVAVSVVSERQNTFSALGAVSRPGTYNIPRKDCRLLEAIALAGGISQTNIRYLYVIRPAPASRAEEAGKPAGPTTVPTGVPTLPELPSLPSLPALPALPALPGETGTTAPSPTTGTGTQPPATSATSTSKPIDNEAALKELNEALNPKNTTAPAKAPAPAIMPRYSMNADESATSTAATTAATTVATTTTCATTTNAADEAELKKTVKEPKWVYVAGQGWVRMSEDANLAAASQPTSAPCGDAATQTATADPFGWHKLDKVDQSRIIAINVRKLQDGNPLMNIVLRNNDIIMVPPLEMGEFYVMGEVQRPGVYSLAGRRVTVKMAIAAAGNLGPISNPKNAILIRRIGDNQEQVFPIDIEAIFRGEENDVFLKPDDVIAVGQSCLSPFLIVLRNAFRLTYGFGFIWDRNFADPLITGPQYHYDSTRFTHW